MKKLILIMTILALILCCGCSQIAPPETTAPTQTGAVGEQEHTDANDDGVCDGCRESVLTTFDVYSVNDLHGKLADGDNHPGVDEMTTYLKLMTEGDDNAIFIAAGDMWQGASESNLTGGLIITEWMNELGFAAMTLGNHDFDWGEAPIEENAEIAEFPFLAINIYDRETKEQVEYCQSSVVVEASGVQVGIIGAIGDCYSSIASDKVEDVYFVTGTQLTELVKAESQRLQDEGVDFIVYSIHDGYGDSFSYDAVDVTDAALRSYYDTSLSDGYVDVVFEAHTHQMYLLQDSCGVYHMQNRGDNKGGLSHVEVTINTVTGTYVVTQVGLIPAFRYQNLGADPLVKELMDKYADVVAEGLQVLGNNSVPRNSNFLCQKVADLYYELGIDTWGDEYDVILGGGFISARSPYNLGKGEVTYGDLQSLFPFDNDIVLCSVKGKTLLSRFINNDDRRYSVSYDADLSEDDIDPNGTYYIVVDSYTADYAPNGLTVVEEYEQGVYARDLLAEFVKNGGFD